MDDRITLAGDKATMKTGSGAVIAFRRDAGSSSRFRLQVDAPFPHQSFRLVNEETITEQVSGLTRSYIKLGEAYRLSRIADSNGNAISISFDARGQVASIENSSGRMLILEWSNGPDVQLLSVADNAGRRVALKQDGKRLRTVTDAAGARWTYDYEGARLTRAADPLKRTLLRVRYDRTGRAVETGDAAGLYLYDYDSTAAAASRLTTITDPIGAKTYFEHSESGTVTAITDSEGRGVRVDYNAANRPVRVWNSFGEETKLTYDAQNRLVRHWSTDGTDKGYGYDERGGISSVTEGGVRTDYKLDENGQMTAAKSSDSTRSYRASYNTRGQLVSLKSDKREISFEYDGADNKTAFTYSDVGRFGLERDAAGRIVRESFPSGLNIFNEYDARGWLMRQSDNHGRSMHLERDQSGAPIAYIRSDGRRLSLVRDETSRVIAMTDFNGSTRRYAYDTRGALTAYTNTQGKQYRYEYDKRGLLRSVIKADGTRTTIERDEKGRVRRILAASRTGNASQTRSKLLSHAIAIQGDMDDPNIDWGDAVVIDTWARYWTNYPMSGGLVGGDGSMFLPMETTGNEGGSGGGQTCEQCMNELGSACESEFQGCLRDRLGYAFFALGACTLFSALGGLIFCGIAVNVGYYYLANGCLDAGKACLLKARNSCQQCG